MATKKTAARKYSPAASKDVEREMKAMKAGTLKSGSGQKVTNPKQAIAIGLSEARKEGKKAPPPPAAKKSAVKKSPAKTVSAKKSAAKKSPEKKSAGKKATPGKTAAKKSAE